MGDKKTQESVIPSELRLKATAALEEQILKELEVEDPKEKTIATLIQNNKE